MRRNWLHDQTSYEEVIIYLTGYTRYLKTRNGSPTFIAQYQLMREINQALILYIYIDRVDFFTLPFLYIKPFTFFTYPVPNSTMLAQTRACFCHRIYHTSSCFHCIITSRYKSHTSNVVDLPIMHWTRISRSLTYSTFNIMTVETQKRKSYIYGCHIVRRWALPMAMHAPIALVHNFMALGHVALSMNLQIFIRMNICEFTANMTRSQKILMKIRRPFYGSE